jgi:hypothetical protein
VQNQGLQTTFHGRQDQQHRHLHKLGNYSILQHLKCHHRHSQVAKPKRLSRHHLVFAQRLSRLSIQHNNMTLQPGLITTIKCSNIIIIIVNGKNLCLIMLVSHVH